MPMKYFSIILLFCLSACGNDTVESLQNLQDSEFNEVMEKSSENNYEPPADGQLTEDQIKMYIAVKEREMSLLESEAAKVKEKVAKAEKADENSLEGMAKGMDAWQQAASYAVLDIRAAQELNYNSAEYEWVKGTITEASYNAMLVGAEKMMETQQAAMDQGMEQAIAELKKTRDEAKDAETRAMLDQHIKDAMKNMEEMKQSQTVEENKLTPADKHNLALYKQHEDELKVVENYVKKWEQFDK